MTSQPFVSGRSFVPGTAAGEVLYSDEPISMMGGVDPVTGVVIDTHHPLLGQSLTGKILVIPSGRGSCSGSGALFEMLLNGTGPAALVFCHHEMILTLGAVIADELFGKSLPILRVSPEDHAALAELSHATVTGSEIYDHVVNDTELLDVERRRTTASSPDTNALSAPTVSLSDTDQRMLDGELGEAVQAAMRVTVRAAELENATELIDVEMAHIDGNFYHGPSSLDFAVKLRDMGAQVCIPTTMNSLKVDRLRWRDHGISPDLGDPSEELADVYEGMGVKPTYTCAPYFLDDRPQFGQQIVWAESNAVVYANSVLGARTLKYPDFLDILIALTGRAPAAGAHLPLPRRATVHIVVPPFDSPDDSLFPMLGYLVGQIAVNEIPVVSGLEHLTASNDDLRAFGAAYATTSAGPMFHIVGHTPEAETLEMAVGAPGGDALSVTHSHLPTVRTVHVTHADLRSTRAELTSATVPEVGLISFGNPHFSLAEIERLADLCDGDDGDDAASVIAAGTEMKITCGREIYRRAHERGFVQRIERFGGEFLTDVCWCFIQAPIIPTDAPSVMTNSGKHAHYGPAQVGRGMHFGSFTECVQAAKTGRAPEQLPGWFDDPRST